MNAPTASLAGVDIRAEIERLRKERNAIILAHYYQRPEIQDLADYVGDSLELSRKAQETDADVIAFCGVRFMAETAKILSPDKTVILPDMDAGCSLEDSCPPDQFKAFREAHPDHIALTYINCSTEVKALSDIIVTSSSAEKILSQIPLSQKIIFGPDKHLGGLSSGGLGFTDTGNKGVIGGLARDFYHRVWKAYQEPAAWKWQQASEYLSLIHI